MAKTPRPRETTPAHELGTSVAVVSAEVAVVLVKVSSFWSAEVGWWTAPQVQSRR